MVPASILAQTQADSIIQRHLEGGPTSSAVAFTSSGEGRMDSSRGFIPRDSFQVEESAQSEVKGLTSSSVLSYDSSGNLINDGSRVITWDVEGKPVKVTTDNLEVLFIYDSNGGRIAKIVKDKSTGNLKLATLYLGGNLEKEINYLPAVSASVATSAKEAASAKEGQQLTANSQPLITTTRYYFANGKRIAQRKTVQNQESRIMNQGLTFIHKDHLSSSTLFTDKEGNPSASSGQGKTNSLLTYYPYGETRPGWDLPAVSASVATSAKEAASAKEGQSTANSQQSTPTNHLYTDQIKDPETDLYYYNARYYDPRIGLFISADTIPDKFTADNINNLKSRLNRYSYVNNNPIVFNDPTGHSEILYDQNEDANNPPNPLQPPEPDDLKWTSDPVIRSRMEWWFYNVAQASVALGLDFRKPPPTTPEEKRKLFRSMTESLEKHGIMIGNPLINNLMLNFFCGGECPALYHPFSNTIFIKNEKDFKDAELNIALSAVFHETFHYYQTNTAFSPQIGVSYGIPLIEAFQLAYVPGAIELFEAEAYALEIYIIPRLTGEKSDLNYEKMKEYIGKEPTSYYWLFSQEAQQRLMKEYILPFLYFEY